jgi:hypothetical protein
VSSALNIYIGIFPPNFSNFSAFFGGLSHGPDKFYKYGGLFKNPDKPDTIWRPLSGHELAATNQTFIHIIRGPVLCMSNCQHILAAGANSTSSSAEIILNKNPHEKATPQKELLF